MTINETREMLGWCSLINLGLMLISYFFPVRSEGMGVQHTQQIFTDYGITVQ